MKTPTRLALVTLAGLFVLLLACTSTGAPASHPAPMTAVAVTIATSPVTPNTVPVPTSLLTIPTQPSTPTRTPVPTAAIIIPTFTPQPAKTPIQWTSEPPPPTVDWHAQWLTYTNPTLGFSVQYPPPKTNVVETREGVYISMLVRPSLVGDMVVGFRVEPNHSNLRIEEVYKRDWAGSDNHRQVPPKLQSVVEDFDQLGYSTVKSFFITEGVVDVFLILVSHGSKIYVISLRFNSYNDMDDPSYQSLFARMMSTFRFIDIDLSR